MTQNDNAKIKYRIIKYGGKFYIEEANRLFFTGKVRWLRWQMQSPWDVDNCRDQAFDTFKEAKDYLGSMIAAWYRKDVAKAKGIEVMLEVTE